MMVGFLGVNAQNTVRYGVLGGINLNSWKAGGVSTDFKVGFDFGVKGEYSLPTEGLYLDGAVMFTQRAADNLSIYYAELPLSVGYKYAVADNIGLFAKTGPMLGVGLFGSEDGTFDVCKRLNLAWGIHGGVELSDHYQISLGYNFGMLNVVKDGSVKMNNLVVSFAYMF